MIREFPGGSQHGSRRTDSPGLGGTGFASFAEDVQNEIIRDGRLEITESPDYRRHKPRASRTVKPFETIIHGTRSAYVGGRSTKGCRCDLCRQANREYIASYRSRIETRPDPSLPPPALDGVACLSPHGVADDIG
jgi:hypothetical protein